MSFESSDHNVFFGPRNNALRPRAQKGCASLLYAIQSPLHVTQLAEDSVLTKQLNST